VAGVAHNGGAANAAVEGGAFGFAIGGGAGVVAVDSPRAVVGAEDDDGVFGEVVLVEGLHDLADGPVEFHHDIAVETGARFAFEFFADVERHVGHGVGDVEEEGLVLFPFNKADGALGGPSGELCLMLVVDVGNGDLAVFPELKGVFAPVFGIGGVVFPHVVGVEQAGVFIESADMGAGLGGVADVPFAVVGRGVVVGLKHLAHGSERRVEAFAKGTVGTEDFGAAGVGAAEQGGPGGGADGLGHVEVFELGALVGEPIDVGRGIGGRAEGTEVGIARVIEEDDDDVGRGLSGRERGGEAEREDVEEGDERGAAFKEGH